MDLITLAMAKACTDSKIPGGGGGGSGLPFVQIETPLSGDDFAVLSDTENAALFAAASSGMPAVVSVTLTAGESTNQICSVASILDNEDTLVYVMPAPQDGYFNGVILIIAMDGAWGAKYMPSGGYEE